MGAVQEERLSKGWSYRTFGKKRMQVG